MQTADSCAAEISTRVVSNCNPHFPAKESCSRELSAPGSPQAMQSANQPAKFNNVKVFFMRCDSCL